MEMDENMSKVKEQAFNLWAGKTGQVLLRCE